jgi:pentatricopeptide repeat protein
MSPTNILSPFQKRSNKLDRQKAEILIRNAVQKRQYNHAIQIFEQYACLDRRLDRRLESACNRHIRHPRVSTQMLNYYLDALVQLGYLPKVEEAITYFKSSQERAPNRRTYELLLRAYIQSLNLRKARLLLSEMVNCGVQFNKKIVHTVLRGEGKWAMTLEAIDAFLGLLSSAGDLEFRDIASYNLIIRAYLRRDRPEKARAVLDKIMDEGLRPDGETFLELMRYQAKKEGSRGVHIIFNSMRMSGIKAEIRHLNVLISTLAHERRMDLKAAAVMCFTHHLIPDIVTCNIILQAFMRGAFKFQDLETHFQEMLKLKILPNAYTFTILLSEYKLKSGKGGRLKRLLHQQLLRNDAHVNRITNNVLLHHTLSKFPESAAPKPSSPRQTIHKNLHIQWDVHTLSTLVSTYSRSSNCTRIVDLYNKVKLRDVKLDRHFYRVLIQSLLTGKKYKASMEAASDLFRSDETLDQVLAQECRIRIAHSLFKNEGYGKKHVTDSIDRFLKFSDEKGVMISVKNCNLIAVACLDIGEIDLAIEILESRYHMRGRFQDLEKGKKLGMSSWVILMRAYARKGREGVVNLRSCLERALPNESSQPTRTLLDFLHHLGVSEELRSTNSADCDYFLQKRLEYITKPRRQAQTRFRSGLTRTNILRWMNELNRAQLREKLQEGSQKASDNS